jgi:hypothetical protein
MHALESNPDLTIDKLFRLQRQYYNAFKHATTRDGKVRDDEELLKKFDDETNNHILFIGWYDYANAIGTLPIEAQVFQIWYFALYPDKLNPDVDPRPFVKTFPDLSTQSRSMRKDALRRKIASSLTKLDLRNDPQTDTRPLILPTN